LNKLSSQQLRSRIGLIIDDYPRQLRQLALSGIYRARKNPPGEEFTSARELWYPPAAVTKPGRLHGAGQVRFYGASAPNTTLLELKPQTGDVFTILVARTKSGTLETLRKVAFIGVERSLAPEGAAVTSNDLFRTSPGFRANLGQPGYRKWLRIDDFISEMLGERIDDASEHKYKLTGAFGDLLFEAPELDAVIYPSVATSNHGLNICLLPEKVDTIFHPSEVWEIVVGEKAMHDDFDSPLHGVSFRRRSQEIASNGAIQWLPPGVGVDPQSVAAFVRHRLRTLATLPHPV
jgi:hypothetical protein